MEELVAAGDDAPVELRCSTVVFRNGQVLLVHRSGRTPDDWVLPGGRPREGEGIQSCARREVLEETGLSVIPDRCVFVLETISPERRLRLVELVFLARRPPEDLVPVQREPGLEPRFVTLDELPGLRLRPPLAGHLRGLHGRADLPSAPFLGNLWRPEDSAVDLGGGMP
jgi:ADP-ribose pyrophosphatase YjhB (NUDIX family)